MNDAKIRKQLERARRVKAGFKRLELWVMPMAEAQIKAYAKKANRKAQES